MAEVGIFQAFSGINPLGENKNYMIDTRDGAMYLWHSDSGSWAYVNKSELKNTN